MHPQVEQYIQHTNHWSEILHSLRELILQEDVQEAFKWKQPVYTFKGKNVLSLTAFKSYVALAFFKGSLFNDPDKVLISPGENSQFFRQLRFTHVKEVELLKPAIVHFIKEAIEIEKSGVKIESKPQSIPVPEELKIKFEQDFLFKEAFKALTPGRQRAYLLYFNQAKQAKTRSARIEKYSSRIQMGKGLNDCDCGLSKRMPACDGSHKSFK